MERFGYIVADPCSGCDYLQIHNILYDNILECIENARLHKNSVDPSKIMYFTILSNTDIVQFLHDTQTEEKRFGFCQLTKYNSAEKYNVYSSHKILFETIVDSILATKGVSWNDIPECPNFEAKFGYFRLLCDDEIVFYLHCL
ncbi:hypothetical protein AVEN_91414-1 [Araneus ventricosus]|uniref:Uncharacterized protein n=1 Tax=Araneus ventricosus TaxID=182803 RepID=A0A4Y2RZ60_ARAVE|nr:hypothetical protein AVEN_174117-1 [Araneus ventricosus]GBM20430.1 hypothetical protein AVEN_137067-1 [Araneus ventricosus]GBM21552.1 hypothetical protein AVEN_119382-1 [Araneus ventricosus]GBM33603.1 hypothetical protein AVEN_115916-1 [Araneus ventricosus]GBM55965.1 hypothetical protein AVEN_240570-1 [Araneus ventricosus]